MPPEARRVHTKHSEKKNSATTYLYVFVAVVAAAAIQRWSSFFQFISIITLPKRHIKAATMDFMAINLEKYDKEDIDEINYVIRR